MQILSSFVLVACTTNVEIDSDTSLPDTTLGVTTTGDSPITSTSTFAAPDSEPPTPGTTEVSSDSQDSGSGTTDSTTGLDDGLGCAEADDHVAKTKRLHDIDGDGLADLHIKAGDQWKIDFAANGFGSWDRVLSGFGVTSLPAPADYDGDGRTDLAVRSDDGGWFIDLSANCLGDRWDRQYFGYGGPVFHPVPSDYDGDGKADLSVKGDTSWKIDFANTGFKGWELQANGHGDLSFHPAPADYDGDGKTDLSAKGDNGSWGIDFATDGFGGAWDLEVTGYGDGSQIPIPADYDGDGKADLSVLGVNGLFGIDYAINGFGNLDEVHQFE